MKVIAVFDIENDRIFDYSCDLHVWNEFGDVRLVKENAMLRPLPIKNKYKHDSMATVDYEDDITLADYQNFGWNACLDEIMGETE